MRGRRPLLTAVFVVVVVVAGSFLVRSSSPSSGPSGAGWPGLGVYMSGNNAGVAALTSSWAQQPNIGSFYLNWNSHVTPLMKTYAAQGRTLQVSFSTRSTTGSYATWNDIAAGTYDTTILTLIKSLDTLGVTVLLSLDCEPDGQYDKTGVAPGQTPAQYVAAANHFADLIHANSTHVQSSIWLTGSRDPSLEAQFLPAHSKLDNIGWDPYKNYNHPAAETPTQLFATFINNVLVPHGYGDIARHINETGIQTDVWPSGGQFTTAQQQAFFNAIPAAMAANDIESVVWFRANSGAHYYIPTDPAVDQTFATAVRALS